jgi:hypothetical protein
MSEKAFASLTSGLLARKGHARPAMRPQGFGLGMGNPEDLGWNDMGYSETAPAPEPRGAGLRLPASLSASQSPIVPAVAANADVPVVVRQQEEIALRFATEAEIEAEAEAEPAIEPPVVVETPVTTAALSSSRAKRPVRRKSAKRSATASVDVGGAIADLNDAHRKAAFTLRLDAERHLRLRLACAVQNRSAQQFVTEALDRLLDSLPDVERLAASLPEQGSPVARHS